MSDDFVWSGAPQGRRYEYTGKDVLSRYYVITMDGLGWVKWVGSSNGWALSTSNTDWIKGNCKSVTDDLHPLVPGQTAIDWTDKLLRDPEVAGWTEAWITPSAQNLDVKGAQGLFSFHSRGGGDWHHGWGTPTFGGKPYRTAATTEDKEEPVTSETESLEEFKARVYKVGKAAAVEHDWCGVFDELMDELGIEKPKVEWPKPGTLFRAPGKWDTDTIGMVLPGRKYRFIRDCGRPAAGTTVWPLDDFDDASGLVLLDV